MPQAAGAALAQQHQTVGRKVVDIAQKARGRVPLKYEFEIIPFFAGERLQARSLAVRARGKQEAGATSSRPLFSQGRKRSRAAFFVAHDALEQRETT